MKLLQKITRYKFGVAILTFLLITNFVWFAMNLASTQKDKRPTKQYPLLSKRIFTESPNDIIVNFVPLRSAIKLYLNKNGLEHSFFFEYLPTGTTIRSKEDNKLAGASLLKLPTIISLYKAVEEGKANLDDQVIIKREWLDDRFGSLHKKGEGAKITLHEAARLSLVESDNTAIQAIRASLGNDINTNESILSQLDVELSNSMESGYIETQIGARDYSGILKCLYLACYLSRENSQSILDYLTQAPDFDRIAKSVPDDIKVAHKIGILRDEVQSDCGIVYIPQRPYTLCIIIKATPSEASMHMQNLSQLVYAFVNDPSR